MPLRTQKLLLINKQIENKLLFLSFIVNLFNVQHEGRPKTVKKDKCAAFGCSHKKSKSRCAFYSFPRYSKANKKWIKASRCNLSKDGFTKKKNFSSRNLRLCECHFARVPYPRSSSQRLKNIAPTLFNFLAADFKASSKPVKRVKRIPIMSAKPLEKPTSPEVCLKPIFHVLKTLDTIGNCQRPVISLVVSQHTCMHKITSLCKFEVNWSSKLRDNYERKITLLTRSCALSDARF